MVIFSFVTITLFILLDTIFYGLIAYQDSEDLGYYGRYHKGLRLMVKALLVLAEGLLALAEGLLVCCGGDEDLTRTPSQATTIEASQPPPYVSDPFFLSFVVC